MVTYYLLFMHQVQEILSLRGCIRKNSNLTWTKNKVKLEYINERQSSSLELVFEIDLRSNKIKC